MDISPLLNEAERTEHHKVKVSSSIKFTSQFQQIKLHNLHKIKDRFDEGYNSYGDPGRFCDMEDLKMIKILMRALYLMLSPLMTVEIIIMTKVINISRKEVTRQITIHPL